MGGKDSNFYHYYRILMFRGSFILTIGFMELRKHIDAIIVLIEIMMEESGTIRINFSIK
jgi:hypothetical protein